MTTVSQRITQLHAFLNESPNDPFLYYALAQEYYKSGNIEEAETLYKKLWTDFNDYVATYYHYGALLAKKGDKENALQIYSEGIRIAKAAGDTHALSELQSAKLNLELAEDEDD